MKGNSIPTADQTKIRFQIFHPTLEGDFIPSIGQIANPS